MLIDRAFPQAANAGHTGLSQWISESSLVNAQNVMLKPGRTTMLTKIRELTATLNAHGIRYCHWKSNLALSQALAGETDVDLLVHRQDATRFRLILNQLCFRPVVSNDGFAFPSVVHYFALDEATGALAHVHAYFRVITGESLAKNYRLPIDEMLLQNTREIDAIPVPTKGAELVVFTLRMMLKHTSLVELALLARDGDQVRKEISWLTEDDSLGEALALIDEWMPVLDPQLFVDCVAALSDSSPLHQRIRLGHRLRSQLNPYARRSVLRAWWDGVDKFSRMAFRRLTHTKRGVAPQSGGAVIAFVGPEATGKSTLLAEVNHWLGESFCLEQIHAGKPKSTLLSVGPNLFVPALRAVLPNHRSGQIETQHGGTENTAQSDQIYPLLYAIRSTLLAHDRRALLTQAHRRAANGSIVLCDRYPSQSIGAPDSPQLARVALPLDRYPLRRRLARYETKLYREIPQPDLVISLSVPVEVAVMRNATRSKYEPEDYLRLRHAQSANLDFGKAPVFAIDTDQPLEQVVLEIKRAIWNSL